MRHRALSLIALAAMLLLAHPVMAQTMATDGSASTTLPGDRSLPAGILHQYPLPSSTEVSTLMDIGIRTARPLDRSESARCEAIVIGARSGRHNLCETFTRDGSMIIFHPTVPFETNEVVNVTLTLPLVGGEVLRNSFAFTTTRVTSTHIEGPGSEDVLGRPVGSAKPAGTLSDGITNRTITVDDGATQGEMLNINYGGVGQAPVTPILLSMDEHGAVLRSNTAPGQGVLFTGKLRNGTYAYWIPRHRGGLFRILDSASWQQIDTLQAAVGDSTDGHDLIWFANGSYAMLGVHIVVQDMTSRGGIDTALVGWSTIQVFDADKNLVWRWDGYDHFGPADIEKHITTNLKRPKAVDAMHSNSIDFDEAGNVIISSRHLCAITKVHYPSGRVDWQLGGLKNTFTMQNDTTWFSYQHDARWLPNGHMLLFDNANYDTTIGRKPVVYDTFSRAVEYALDTVAHTATHVWEYRHDPPVLSFAMGSAERLLPSGNTLIGWGAVPNGPFLVCTEVTPAGKTVFEMKDGDADYNYRVTKYPTAGQGITGGDRYAGAPRATVAQSVALPESASLDLSEPGGTSQELTITYITATAGEVSMALYDALGRMVAEVAPTHFEPAGTHTAVANLRALPSGAYYCVLRTPTGLATRTFQHIR